MTDDEIKRIEIIVNEKIQENREVEVSNMNFKDAVNSGAIAIFNEKYGDVVRVVKISDFSKELCGGSHILATGDIGFFKITQERSIASGIRRIEAITGMAALEYIQKKEKEIAEISSLLKAKPDDIIPKIKKLAETIKECERQIEKLRNEGTRDNVNDIISSNLKDLGGIKVVASLEKAESIDELRNLGDRLKDRLKSGIIVLGADIKGKASIIVIVSKDLAKKIPAGNIIKRIARIVGGEGGGKNDFAQAGGKDVKNLPDAINRSYEIISEETN